MIKHKLIYLAIAIVSGAFFILYRDPLSLILLLVVLAIPPLLLLLVLLMRLGLRMRVESDRSVYSYGDKAKISVMVANYSLLPISQIQVFVRYKNSFFRYYDVGEFHFFAPPFSKNRYEIEVDSRHTGKVDIVFKKARVLDYFGMFSVPIKIKQTLSVFFLPTVHSVEPTLRKNNYAASESNRYSKHKAGDDPAEVFAIREYAEGDKLSRIHWKLTSKQDTYMVKDYSLPINESVLLLPELVFGDGGDADLDRIDAVLAIAFSLSHLFVERKTLHAIGYYNAEADKVCIQPIQDLDDLYAVFGDMFNTARYDTRPVLAAMDPEKQQGMSHVLYISENVTADRLATLSANKSDNVLYTVINVVDGDVGASAATEEELNVIAVHKNRIGECLNDVTV